MKRNVNQTHPENTLSEDQMIMMQNTAAETNSPDARKNDSALQSNGMDNTTIGHSLLQD